MEKGQLDRCELKLKNRAGRKIEKWLFNARRWRYLLSAVCC
jgi:hypothetical protein